MILTIIGSGALAWLLAESMAPVQWLKDKFNAPVYMYCSLCVGFWVGMTFSYLQGYDIINILLMASLSSVIAETLSRTDIKTKY